MDAHTGLVDAHTVAGNFAAVHFEFSVSDINAARRIIRYGAAVHQKLNLVVLPVARIDADSAFVSRNRRAVVHIQAARPYKRPAAAVGSGVAVQAAFQHKYTAFGVEIYAAASFRSIVYDCAEYVKAAAIYIDAASVPFTLRAVCGNRTVCSDDGLGAVRHLDRRTVDSEPLYRRTVVLIFVRRAVAEYRAVCKPEKTVCRRMHNRIVSHTCNDAACGQLRIGMAPPMRCCP